MPNDNPTNPRVVFMGLASCFGCQINITNMESYLLDVLGQLDLSYWQLTTSGSMPEEFDVAVIEGAVTSQEAERLVKELREKAKAVITIGACANTGGIPAIASPDYEESMSLVYGDDRPAVVADDAYAPRAVSNVIDVDYRVDCCPVDPMEFVDVLNHALHGSNQYRRSSTLCGQCKSNERGCFYGRGIMCLGLVTRSGCGARCPELGRPCNGCAGLSDDANLDSARRAAEASGIDPSLFDSAVGIFNQIDARVGDAQG